MSSAWLGTLLRLAELLVAATPNNDDSDEGVVRLESLSHKMSPVWYRERFR